MQQIECEILEHWKKVKSEVVSNGLRCFICPISYSTTLNAIFTMPSYWSFVEETSVKQSMKRKV